MVNENQNLPAFPVHPEMEHKSVSGLSKREYFAGLAMQGILSSSSDRGREAVAKLSVEFADALLDKLRTNNHDNTRDTL